MSSEDIPAAPAVYSPGKITVYGVKINKMSSKAVIPYADKLLSIEITDAAGASFPSDEVATVVAYGYSYEGHCYRFDRPKIFVFDGFEEVEKASGCGFGEDYMMWTISAKQTLLEMTTATDLAETLILEASLPGNRAPSGYSAHMQLAHRGGRLNRPGGAS